MEEYIRKIKEIAAKCTQNQSDGYSQIMKICNAIDEEFFGITYTVQETSDAFDEPYYLADELGQCYTEEDGTVPTFTSIEDGETYLKEHFPVRREIIVKISAALKDDCIPLHESALLVKQNLEYRFSDNKVEILSEREI